MSVDVDRTHAASSMAATDAWVRPVGLTRERDQIIEWTRLGTLDGSAEPVVDPCGAVQAAPGLPVIDWWIAGDDRWYFPSREATIRQSLVRGTPVVETRMRVKGGDLCHRVYVVNRSSGEGGGELLVIEVENLAAVPCGVAFALRPFGVDGVVPIHEVRLDGAVLRADGRTALVLPRPPGGSLAGVGADGDLAVPVAAGAAVDPAFAPISCPMGLAQAVVVLPIAHATSIRVVVPLPDGSSDFERRAADYPRVLPSSENVAQGWRTQVRDLTRVIVPDPRLQAVLDAAFPTLLAAPFEALADGAASRRAPGALPRWDHVAAIAGLLDRGGLWDEAASLLARAAAHRLDRPDADAGDDIPLVVAAAFHLDRHPDQAFAVAMAECVTRIVSPVSGRRARLASGAAVSSARVAPTMTAAAVVLNQAGSRRAAAAATSAIRASATESTPVDVPTAGLDAVQRARAAGQALAAGRADSAWRTLDTLLDAVSPTGAWPGSVTAGGDRHAVGATAAVASLAIDLLCRSGHEPGSLHLLSHVPEVWLGSRLEAHQVMTSSGAASFAVRWHGERPAMLWEVRDAGSGDDPVRLDAPGLDPDWHATERAGEALLAAVTLPEKTAGRGAVISGLQIGRSGGSS